MAGGKSYVVEHLDPELEQWSALEYRTIAQECAAAGSTFTLSSIPAGFKLPSELKSVTSLQVETRSIEDVVGEAGKPTVCLLDPAAKQELSPEDGDRFETFLFGGILGDDPPRGKQVVDHCLWR